MAFLRMDNPGKKELAACVKQMALISSRKVLGKNTSILMLTNYGIYYRVL